MCFTAGADRGFWKGAVRRRGLCGAKMLCYKEDQ